ncbi:nitroreductase family protein [Peribacillus saganii]|uniref:Nitroreductase family protein n=1 Tax=Peribacillus saganii TaxID=2303992 RepID=A0A372LD96_9BACI|nr:nitroreductase family protein [Peribacillus saganii]RFU63551.1 nitroreductase family protein [Peribacillus saganii]
MTASNDKNILEVIRERKSVRVYDPNYEIPREEIEKMLEKASLAPSSSNLQPWRFIVITDQDSKKELRAIANNQAQVETASAVIAVLGVIDAYKDTEKIYRSSVEAGYMNETNMQRMVENTNNLYPKISEEARRNIAQFDAGLVSMQLMLIAKAYGYDTVPMGGFDRVKFAEKFNLPEGIYPIVLIPLGKAAAPAHNTTRLPVKDIVKFI